MNAIASSTRSIAGDFIAHVNDRSIDRVVSILTADCVIEIPTVPPSGMRFETEAEHRGYWTDVLTDDDLSLSLDPSVASTDDRAVIRWRTARQHGIYVLRVRDGQIGEIVVYGWD